MKSFTHKQIAQTVALVGVVVQGVAVTIVAFSTSYRQITFSVLMALVTFFVLFTITYYMVRHYIKRKIKPIYKLIETNSPSVYKKLDSDKFDDSNIISDVTTEVSDWIAERVKELDTLKKQELYRKEYVGNVSHELKTPIFNIQGYIETLLDGGLEDTTVNRKYLENASRAINRMITIVSDLETISGLESGNLIIKPEIFDICALCSEVIESQEILASSKKIRILLKPFSGNNALVLADKRWIMQVITNLVVNSIMYGRENGTTKIQFLDMEHSILVDVKDTGIGIEPADQKRIFERFYRVDKSRSRNSGGTGLGLSIVKHVLDAHGKSITVHSEPGKGTSFTFTLDKPPINA